MKKAINTTALHLVTYRTWYLALFFILLVFFAAGTLGEWRNLTKV